MRILAGIVVLALSAWLVPAVQADGGEEPSIQLEATIDAAQETPAPSNVPANAGGMGTFVLDVTQRTVQYTVTAHDLSGSGVVLAHIHRGKRGVAGPIVITLDAATLTGTASVPDSVDLEEFYDQGLYVNLHTAQNPGGEVRGQIALSKTDQTCSCKTAANPKAFKTCVKSRIKALDKSQKKSDEIKLLKKVVKKASCGKTKGPKKAIACCLPQTPAGNIVIGHLCKAIPEPACSALGGLGAVSLGQGSSCFPTNPCVPPASPSGAFLD